VKHQLIILSAIVLALLSCKKESPLYVYTTVDGFNWETTLAQGDYTYRLRTIARSTTGAVRHIVISTFDTRYGDRIVLDTTLADPVKDLDMMCSYRTPVFEDTTRVDFSVKAYATDGETASSSFLMKVLPSSTPLPSVDNITMYSNLSGKASCFSLVNRTTFMKCDTLDIKSLYFYDVAPLDSSDNLALMWRSNDIFFARSESFNYAEATSAMVKSAYETCQRAHTIQNIKYDDVLLIGTATEALGVLKVNYVLDESERVNDRYNFSMKLISDAIK